MKNTTLAATILLITGCLACLYPGENLVAVTPCFSTAATMQFAGVLQNNNPIWILPQGKASAYRGRNMQTNDFYAISVKYPAGCCAMARYVQEAKP